MGITTSHSATQFMCTQWRTPGDLVALRLDPARTKRSVEKKRKKSNRSGIAAVVKSADGDLSARPLTRTAVRCFVRRFLCGRSVPRYMVPSGIRFQASIPVTKNGKADRRAIYGAMSHDNSAAASSDESLGESSTVDEPAGADETGYVGPCR